MTRQPFHKNRVRRKRSDQGTWQKTTRDVDAWWMIAQQKYVRMDTLGSGSLQDMPKQASILRSGNRNRVGEIVNRCPGSRIIGIA